MRYVDVLSESPAPPVPALLYHGTTPGKARAIVAGGFVARSKLNTFGKSISFSTKPVGTRSYDRGAILVYRFRPGAKVISLSAFQKSGRGAADAVIGGADGYYADREVAVFDPACIEFVGYYNLHTKQVDPSLPQYPRGFTHSWASEPAADDEE